MGFPQIFSNFFLWQNAVKKLAKSQKEDRDKVMKLEAQVAEVEIRTFRSFLPPAQNQTALFVKTFV
jgi:hypothetical protein